VVAGLQLDFMELVDSALYRGRQGLLDSEPAPLMENGEEAIYSGFLQVKQNWGEALLINAGFRYDYKDRGPLSEVSNLEPRLALVYLPNDSVDWKISFASSFVDAPYWLRYNQLASYLGGADLRPEYLDSLQLTGAFHWDDDRHKLETNFFHNRLTDFIFRDTSVSPTDTDAPIYRNAGELESIGVELSYRYHDLRYRLNGNATWQHALNAVDYGEMGGDIYNIPSLTTNLSLDIKLPTTLSRNTWFNATLRYLSSQRSPILVPFLGMNLEENRVDAVFLVNTGVYFEKLAGTSLNLDLRAYNALDEEWFQGGSVQYPYPQTGRWINLSLSYTF